MSKSSGSGLFGRKSSGSVTVVATHIERKYARNAKVAFWVTGLVVGLLTASVLVADAHPILAFLGGGLAGFVVGAVAWLLTRAWPALRIGWWWLPEIVLAGVAVYGFAALAHVITDVVVRTAVLFALVGIPAAIPVLRRAVVAWFMCLVVRHRLRQCFTDVIKSNQHGSLPFILLARPTPVGERVWVWLRPGLSKTDIATRLEKLATGCWATTVMVDQPGSNAALLRLDIKRREVLTATVSSPLVGMVDPDTPVAARPAPVFPADLNLADVPINLIKYVPSARAGRKPATETAAANGSNNGPANGSANGSASDENEWI